MPTTSGKPCKCLEESSCWVNKHESGWLVCWENLKMVSVCLEPCMLPFFLFELGIMLLCKVSEHSVSYLRVKPRAVKCRYGDNSDK